MGYFPVRYDSRFVIYDCRAFVRQRPQVTLRETTNRQISPIVVGLPSGLQTVKSRQMSVKVAQK